MRVLIDTNILLRSVERQHPQMRVARHALRFFADKGIELCVSSQNIAEFWNVCTRPTKLNGLGLSIGATERLTARIESFFTLLPDSIDSFRQWRRLVVTNEVKGAKVHDARLVAIMQTNGVRQLLTFNTADFRRYPSIDVVDPTQVLR